MALAVHDLLQAGGVAEVVAKSLRGWGRRARDSYGGGLRTEPRRGPLPPQPLGEVEGQPGSCSVCPLLVPLQLGAWPEAWP